MNEPSIVTTSGLTRDYRGSGLFDVDLQVPRGTVYLAFAIATTALAASLVRSTVAITGTTLATLLALPILGTIHAVDPYLPSALVNAPVQLVDGTWTLTHFLPALAITAAASTGALALAITRLRTREI